MKTCSEIIRGLREDSDAKQAEIAELIGTTQQQYSNYETGESELSLRALNILANHYGVSADYLMGRTACKDGLDALNKSVHGDYTVGALITDTLTLSTAGRADVIKYLALQKNNLLWQRHLKKHKKSSPPAAANNPAVE